MHPGAKSCIGLSPDRGGIRSKCQVPEYGRYLTLIFPYIASLSQPFCIPSVVLKKAHQIEPDLLHPQHGVSAASKCGAVALIELVMESPQPVLVRARPAAGLIYEGRIVADLDPKTVTVQELGLYMAGSGRRAVQ